MSKETWTNLKNIFAKASEMDESQRSQYLDEACGDNLDLRKEIESLLDSFIKSENFIENPALKVPSWQKISDILGVALEKPEEQRLDYLKEVCGDDEKLFAEVESFLAFDTAKFQSIISPSPSVKFKSIGNYKIIKEIGHGGMGVVYLASREDEQFRQRVAIKVVKRGIDNEEVLRRFRNERQILASLKHPNIAQLLDGGTTDEGSPYFVMEYVEGLPLTQYCDEKQLSTNERLDIFKKICSAVQHAHQNLVIHRDLKPSNILITQEGEVKLLDFGIAKFLNPELAGELNQTQTQFRMMTPEYASPEQIKGTHITTSSDIYSLGVILYELLTGERPFKFEGKSLEQILQAVTQSEPIAPSAVISDQRSVVSGKNNHQSAIRNPQSLKGDLDNIVLMALRKEPSRRYKSAEKFAEDIQRYLKGLPVSARPNTFSYRAEKFVRRNLAASIVGGLLILSLIGGLGFSIWQARVAARERDRAIAEQLKTESLNRFLQQILQAAAPDAKGKDAKILDVLIDAEQNVENEFANQPELKAQAYLNLGKTYSQITDFEKADALLQKALQISENFLPADNPIKSETLIFLGGNSIAQIKYDKTEYYLKRGIEMERNLFPGGSRNLAIALSGLGEFYARSLRFADADAPINESISIFSKITDEKDPDYAYAIGLQGRQQSFSGDLVNGEANLRKSLSIFRTYPKKYEARLVALLLNLGILLSNKKEYDEAIKTLNEGNQIAERLNISTLKFYAKSYTCNAYGQMQNAEKIIEVCPQAIKLFSSTELVEGSDNLLLNAYLGLALTHTGKPPEGEPYLRKALTLAEKLDPNDEKTIISLSKNGLGECLLAQNKFDEARPLLEDTYPIIKSKLGNNNPYTVLALKRLISFYEKTNNQELANKYKAELPQ